MQYCQIPNFSKETQTETVETFTSYLVDHNKQRGNNVITDSISRFLSAHISVCTAS